MVVSLRAAVATVAGSVAACCEARSICFVERVVSGLVLRVSRVAECCRVLQCVAEYCSASQRDAVRCSVLQCVAVCCSVLQCVAVCCSALQCILSRLL